MSEKYKNLKVKELQELLQKNNLSQSGKKEELIERLVNFDEKKVQVDNLEDFDDLLDDSNADSSKPIDLSTEIDELDALDDTTTKEVAEEVEEKKDTPTTTPRSSFKFTPITFDKKPADVATTTTPTTETPVVAKTSPTSNKAASDAEKALERAKRFGVQLNESAKKDIRAERFGLKKGGNDAEALKKRAEKFGTNKPKTTGGIDPEVLKKRAERFGLNGKVPVTVDAAEEEKKRKRAERFGADPNKKTKI